MSKHEKLRPLDLNLCSSLVTKYPELYSQNFRAVFKGKNEKSPNISSSIHSGTQASFEHISWTLKVPNYWQDPAWLYILPISKVLKICALPDSYPTPCPPPSPPRWLPVKCTLWGLRHSKALSGLLSLRDSPDKKEISKGIPGFPNILETFECQY